MFKTDRFNCQTGYICSEHWNIGQRETSSFLQDVPIPLEHFNKLKMI